MGMGNGTGTFEYVHLRPIDTKEIRRPHTSIYLALNMRSFRFIVEMSLIQLRYESDFEGFRAIWAWHLKCREGWLPRSDSLDIRFNPSPHSAFLARSTISLLVLSGDVLRRHESILMI
jgi:hypothetical protein